MQAVEALAQVLEQNPQVLQALNSALAGSSINTNTQSGSSVNTNTYSGGSVNTNTYSSSSVNTNTYSGSSVNTNTYSGGSVNTNTYSGGSTYTNTYSGNSTYTTTGGYSTGTGQTNQNYTTQTGSVGGAAAGTGGAGTTYGVSGSTLGTSSTTYGASGSTLGASTTSLTGSSSNIQGDPNFSEDTLYQYIKTTLTPQNGDFSHSGGELGAWDPSTAQGKKNLDSFYQGIVASHNEFFQNVPISTFAKAVVANAAVESTLDPTLGGGGLLQYSPFYFSDDFKNHGKAFGTLDPNGSFDPTDPGQQVEIWAWYTKNALVDGGTRPSQWGSGASGGVANTYGDLWPTWVGGPGNADGNMQSYVPNIQAYFDKIGTQQEFQQLQNTPLSANYTDTK